MRSRFPGFDDEEVSRPEPQIVTPESASWGLSVAQMRSMGIATAEDRTGGLNPVSAVSQSHRPYKKMKSTWKSALQRPSRQFYAADGVEVIILRVV